MISADYGFHNENDYSWVDRDSNLYKMKNCRIWESRWEVRQIYRELTRFYNRLTYWWDGKLGWKLDKDEMICSIWWTVVIINGRWVRDDWMDGGSWVMVGQWLWMVDNGCQMMTDDNSLYRYRSRCGTNMDMDCTAIG